jgi:hypothetical protein
MLYLPDQSVDDAIRIFAWHANEHDKSRLTLHQGGDVAVLSSSQQVALPVTRDRSVLYLGRPLSDGYRVNDLPARLSASAGVFAPAHQSARAQTRDECQSARKFDPISASNFDPFERRARAVALAPSELVGVAETARARVVGGRSSSRLLKRQLSLPVSTISQ